MQCSHLTEPWVADTFAIVGYYSRLEPRDPGTKLAPDVELMDPEILFQFPPPPPLDDSTDPEANRLSNAVNDVIRMEFCHKDGYRTCASPVLPTFHTLTLTSMPDARRIHASILTLYERHKVERCISFNSKLFVPKFLIFLSKLNMPAFFKTCLDYFYSKFFVGRADVKYLNKAIALLVQNVRVPLPGCFRQLDFGLGHCLTLQAQAPMSLPRTGNTIYRLFHLLGMHFVVEAVRCLLNEMKVVVYHREVTTVTECCEALLALLWPFPYNYVYAPAVGRRVLEDLLEAPTIFCIGTSSLPEDGEVFSRNGIILVDLEKGVVDIPQNVQSECLNIDEKPRIQLLSDLTFVISSEEFVTDWNDCTRRSDRASRIEMRLRACFLRLYAQMFGHYRRSMSAVRFYPQPRVFFDIAHFFGQHGFKFGDKFSQNSLTLKMISSFFSQFFIERYHPFREVDLFDELCAKGCDVDLEEITQRLMSFDFESDHACDTLSPNNIDLISALLTTSSTTLFVFPRPRCDEIVDLAATTTTGGGDNGACVIAVDSNSLEGQRRVPVDFTCNEQESDKNRMIISFLGHALDRLFGETVPELSSNDKRLLNSVLLDTAAVRRQFCSELSRRSLTSGRLSQANFDFITELVCKLVDQESQIDENGIVCALLEAFSNVSYRPSPVDKPIYLHHRFTLDVWWTESFWQSWLGKFVAAELAAHYSGEAIPDVHKEPGHSMSILADVLASPSDEAKQLAEERRVIESCRLCIDLMLPLLLDHPSVSPSATPMKKKKNKVGLFKRLNSSNRSSPSTPPSSQHRQRVFSLISSVISQFAHGVYLLDHQKAQLLQSIVEKLNHQNESPMK